MKPRLVVAFSSVEDAKAALGSIKKENWNANLIVILAEPEKQSIMGDNNDRMEFGSEFFLTNQPEQEAPAWPGLKEDNLPGVGRVKVGISGIKQFAADDSDNNQTANHDELISGVELLKLIQGELLRKQIISLVEVEPEMLPRVRFILESNGATILDNQASA